MTLPIEYQEVEYIESTGTQYINTGIGVDDHNSFKLRVAKPDYSNSQGYVLSQDNNSIRVDDRTFTWYSKNYNFRYTASSYNIFYNFECGYNYFRINGEDAIQTPDSDTAAGSYVYIFARNNGTNFSSVRLQSIQIYNSDNELVFDGVPCYRKSDNEIGLYDLVNDNFITNGGTGTFDKGPDAGDSDIVYVNGDIQVGGTLKVHYKYAEEFQRYRDGQAIIGETNNTYTLLITDQGHEITCAVYYDGDIEVAEPIFIDYYSLEVKPIQKEYIVKLYDGSMNFVKVLPASLITNNISFSESINAGQGQLTLNVNLPIDTDYFDNTRYCKVYVSDNRSLDDKLIYSGWLSKVSRTFSNNKENIQIIFLSLYTLLNDVYFMQDGEMIFQIEDDPANIIKTIIDYFNTLYPGILSYTNESIDSYGEDVYLEFNTMTCGDALKSVMNGLSYYIFIGADGVVQFHNKPQTITHNFTYEKDITALTIPEDYEQVANAVRATFKYIGGSHTGITDVATDNTSIAKFGRKEKIISNDNLYGQTAGETYRDSYMNEYKNGKKNITLTVSTLYEIENIHPGDTVRIRNIDLSINNLQISKIDYTYEQVKISLEYYTNIAKEVFNS